MDKIVTENLFLLEFLVDSVNLDECLCREIGDVAGDTCVSVQFLDNPPLSICEDDFAPKRKYCREMNNMKSGKSCLFSLTPSQAEEAVYQFDVYVRVFRKMKAGVVPDKIHIGNSLISIVNLFNELLASINVPTNESSPTAKTLKDVFVVTDEAGQVVGDIGMYIRMSCFGKLIVTQFQMNLDDKSVLFKDKEGHSLYRYKKAGKKETECPKAPCTPYAMAPPPSPYNAHDPNPCQQESTFNSIEENSNCRYHEIGAAMGGNALTIRVHKDSKVEQMENDDDTCTCTPSYRSSKAPRAFGGGCVQQEQSFSMRPACDDGANGNVPFSLKIGTCEPRRASTQPQRGSMNACAPTGNMNVCPPGGGNPNTYTLGGGSSNVCPARGGSMNSGGYSNACPPRMSNNVTVVPPTSKAADGTQFTEVSDPNKDVFILRIGKKAEGTEKKKNNLELELCTPKGPDIKPPARKETRDSQWDDADALAAGGGGKGGKGKGKGKGGKGKDKGKGKGKKK